MRLSILFCLALSAAAPALAHAPANADVLQIRTDHTAEWATYLQAQRAEALDHLRTYAGARVYPINDVQLGAISMLRDANGNPCAMAYLVEQTGHRVLIDTLAREANGARFDNQEPGMPLYDWTLTSGLLLEEAAMVQEPDFFIGNDMMELPDTVAINENERLYVHFSTTTEMLAMQSDTALALAIERLGDRVFTAPPSAIVTTL